MFDFCGGGDIIRVKDRFSTGSVQVWRKFNTTQPVCQFAEIGVQTLVWKSQSKLWTPFLTKIEHTQIKNRRLRCVNETIYHSRW